ncbi:dihydrolipoamide dehydrogenase [Kineococcus xinjiangensis]|uniref:NAD(P)H dehydrogenase (quinone) n=1 Tax=Kineococcus xinjiangensis TaxID=512762 RepID=A0A2S6IU53_9ACTN|nr:NAD(P)H-quinone dehydrogenase [Kineococcus xinjiangensis]PPK97701.1 dihydrolipoamide dehydrogenase [Kineococcus xinjiangensis]
MSSSGQTKRTRVGILGGGPGGYEAALVAAQLGADVTIVEDEGLGGSAVLTDVVPSKTLIATAELMTTVGGAAELGVRFPGGRGGSTDAEGSVTVDLARVNQRVKSLAFAQSMDIRARLEKEGVRVLNGRGRLDGPQALVVTSGDDEGERVEAEHLLLSVGTSPRTLPAAQPDGERILTWKQLYDLDELPEKMIVVGSGVTGAEFAGAYRALGSDVVLVSSRERVLPGEDADAAEVLEDVFRRRGMTVMSRSRAESAVRHGDTVTVTLSDGRTVEGSHCLIAVGAIPNTAGLGLEEAGVEVAESGHVTVDRVSRTSARGVYAAGDCTGVFPLASVAAMQGRIAMWHALGDAVSPLALRSVSSNIFTSPEIATVGWTQAQIDSGEAQGDIVKLPLSTNARAKMLGIHDGFVKLFCRSGSGTVIGGVIVAPRASELIFPLTLAVEKRLNVDDVAHAFTIYPSLSGSLAEAARQLHVMS